MSPSSAFLFSSLLVLSLIYSHGNALSSNYYENSCPQVEDIVTQVITEATKKDKTVPAALLRMHFHDCFIRVFFCIFFENRPDNVFLLLVLIFFKFISHRGAMLRCY